MNMFGKKPVFKTGIWIKEQQGQLTIGSLDKDHQEVMVIPDHLSVKILEFENDMMDALYGDEKIRFEKGVLDIRKLLANLNNRYKDQNLRISFSEEKDHVFNGRYDEIYALIEAFIQSSISESAAHTDPVTIYINATVLKDHLCIIYRDSGSISNPSKLKKQFDFIKSVLKGEISHKVTSGNKSYYDMVIPSKRPMYR